MNFLDPQLEEYVERHTSEENEVLKKLNRETWAKMLMPRMLSGHIQGRVLSMFSHMIKPKHILEIGTFTGYSAICMAEGLADKGILHTIELNDELEEFIKKYFQEAGMEEKIVLHIGNALEIIPALPITFDLVFIDADKENYSAYYDLVFDKLSVGGFIIADNVLWSGKVLLDYEKLDTETNALVDFNMKIQNDNRVENVLLPIRDGLMIVRKK
ncbi:MAG: O-methyltransferase [Bacteroidetes bacterium]|nr:O-methyltransferase [Bacteroidota bacterium]MBV6460299.1 putative O-methyltransferase [Flavobacteriales bacterium]WKZ74667.1 MAG: O-methyltransferase [Vicingaceae bacterium]MCL4815835.1 O-methyltransferase [Flavobacteriales bacterium]NOG94974.1 O-methyltransferase [Bacteroidota bacterium]